MAKVLVPPEDWWETLRVDPRVLGLSIATRGLVDGKYHHWDTVFRLRPPEGFTTEEWWRALKLARVAGQRALPLHDVDGEPLTVNLVDPVAERLHKIDQMTAGRIGAADKVTNPAMRDRYVMSSLIEEAITSSQLEGASTTRRDAQEMLRTGRRPRDRSERMILNNYLAMQRVRELVGERLTPGLVCELHRIVTDGTLDDPSAAGRPQTPAEVRVAVYDNRDVLVHTPPPATETAERLRELCAFANGAGEPGTFIHPVVRAIAIHFMVGYIHPFEDGNGRTARALFYWSMLSQGYWLTEFLTISAILRKAPGKYSAAFRYTETDENDLTYFVIHQLDVIMRAVTELNAYLDRKIAEVSEAERLARSHGLNHRQLALLGHAMRNPDAAYTIQAHAHTHKVVYQTARTDLLGLADLGLLTVRRIGRADNFFPPPDLVDRLKASGGFE